MPELDVRAALAPVTPTGTIAISVDAIMSKLGAPRPLTVTDLVHGLDPVTLSFRLNAGTCTGSCEIVVSRDGGVTYTGRVHNSGGLDARYIAITSIPVVFGPMLVAHQSTAGGTFGLDPRDDDWHEVGQSQLAANDWWAFRGAAVRATTQFGTNTGAFEILSSVVGAGTGVWVFSL